MGVWGWMKSRGFGALVNGRDEKFLKGLEAVELAGSSNMHHY